MLPVDFANFMHHERWLHTSFGFRSPKEAILFSSEWGPIALVSSLPFINDSDTQGARDLLLQKLIDGLGC
uniref:Uncharacterized protein n=1 Tax=Arundo donax TaxID=35708 RepID=A0A0A8ZZG1_ARUDO